MVKGGDDLPRVAAFTTRIGAALDSQSRDNIQSAIWREGYEGNDSSSGDLRNHPLS